MINNSKKKLTRCKKCLHAKWAGERCPKCEPVHQTETPPQAILKKHNQKEKKALIQKELSRVKYLFEKGFSASYISGKVEHITRTQINGYKMGWRKMS